jgi:diaminopimelate decarboxylase
VASSSELARVARLAPSLREAARQFGTPVAITEIAALAAASEQVRAAFPDPWLRAFSIKANDVAAVVERVASLGFDANVVSRGEWAIARRAGVPNERITLEGIGKADADLAAAVASAQAGVPLRWIALESVDEAAALVAHARRRARRGPVDPSADRSRLLDVLFRFNPEVTPETHDGLAVGRAGSKFGMTAPELTEAVALVSGTAGLVARGIHVHIGSQLRAVDAWRDGVRRSLALLALIAGTRERFDTLDLGGGFPVTPADDPSPDPARFARELPELIEAIPADRRPERLAIEPGRAIVARAGLLIGRVLHVRPREEREVVLDVGMTELIRPALYGARHEVVALTSLGQPAEGLDEASFEPAMVDGPICESTDRLDRHRLPPLRRGDLVAVLDTGAYGASLASAYNGRPRPPQVLLEASGGLVLARRRGSVAALG